MRLLLVLFLLLFSMGASLVGCTDIRQEALTKMATDLQQLPSLSHVPVVEPYPYGDQGEFPEAMALDQESSPKLHLLVQQQELEEPRLFAELEGNVIAMSADMQAFSNEEDFPDPQSAVEPATLMEEERQKIMISSDLQPPLEPKLNEEPEALLEPPAQYQLATDVTD